jgi:hypothetical protein
LFVLWLILFAGGIFVDTRPYRLAISASGVSALERPPSSGTDAATPPPPQDDVACPPAAGDRSTATARGVLVAWGVVLACFLPVNLAWVCCVASLLGGFGNRANLSDDSERRRARDGTNPFVSSLLRGFFVYLVVTSGLLILDDAPFASPTPGQYVRLAGFLSLFSFVVSYQPRLFNQLIVWAFHRIQMREGEDEPAHGAVSIHQKRTVSEEVSVTGTSKNDSVTAGSAAASQSAANTK